MEKLALIELGAEKLKLTIMEIKQGGYFRIIEEIEQDILLGRDVEEGNIFKSVRINNTIEILKNYRKICNAYGVGKTKTIASSIVKQAKNQNSFIEEIYNKCGFNVKILTPEEEVKATYTGIINTINQPKATVVNVGSKQTIVLQYNRRNILNQEIIPYGTLNLAQEVESDELSSVEKCEKMVDIFKEQLKKVSFINELDEIQVIGAGEAFQTLGKLARKVSRYPLDLAHNFELSNELLNSVYDFIKTLDLDKAKRIKGISEGRADSVASGISIAKACSEIMKFENIVVSNKGIREGLIYNYAVPETNDKPLSDMIGFSLENIKEFYDFGNSNSKNVYNLSIILFKQLKVLHKLHRFYVRPLRIAAYMYDAGKRIRFEDYEKNNFNVILNSDVDGVTQRELLLASFVAMCQNLDNFNLSEWVKYKALFNDDDLDAVRKMGVLIKLASCLDKSNTGNVKDVTCDILGDSVIIKTIVEGNPTFEIMEAKKIGPQFKKIFNKYIEVI